MANESSTLHQLRAFVEKLEQLEKARKEIYGDAKSTGFDVGALGALIAQRSASPNEREAFELYQAVLGGSNESS